jgi:hypothetical protein
MGLVAEFNIDCTALPLANVAASVPEATMKLDLQYNHGRRPLFLVTVQNCSQSDIENALTNAYDVEKWECIGQAGDTRRYQALPALSLDEQLGEHLDDLAGLQALATADAFIERIDVVPDGWRQTGWFADRETFKRFSSFWQQNADFQLHRLTPDKDSEPAGDGLTDRQREALRIAYERGYFDIPRQASLEDVAAELDLSPSSVSERLRRAQTQLIEETVATTWPPLPT